MIFTNVPLPKTIICLMGPTASGKTNLAVELVQSFPLEIISVDSAMVYKDMDIGTAKPEDDVLKLAPHRLLNLRDPSHAYSAADFCVDAVREIEAIFANNKTPLLVGGTMLYFRALQAGLSDLPSADPAVREKLSALALEKGWDYLHECLMKVDPVSAQRIHPHDTQRIQRALEVYELTGSSLTDSQQQFLPISLSYNVINIAIYPENRAVLHERIAKRFDEMLAQGFVDEVKKLFQRDDLNLDTPAMRCVGYRQVCEYLLGHLTYEEMREKSIIATRQLAKRQLTWLRHWPQPLQCFDSESLTLMRDVTTYLMSLDGLIRE
jgi:tRNA dimethylallyltransferase